MPVSPRVRVAAGPAPGGIHLTLRTAAPVPQRRTMSYDFDGFVGQNVARPEKLIIDELRPALPTRMAHGYPIYATRRPK